MPGFLVRLSRWWHKRLFQKLPKTRLLYCEMFNVMKLGQLGSFYAYATICLDAPESRSNNPAGGIRILRQAEVDSEGHRQCTLPDFIFYICLEICWWNLRIEPLMFLNRVIIYVSRLSENVHIITTIFMEKFLCVSNQMVTYARKQYHCLNCVI